MFQSLVNNVLCDILVTGYISVYINDILIFSETREEHAQHICSVLQHLHEWAFSQTGEVQIPLIICPSWGL